MMIHGSLKALTEVVFFTVLFVTVVYVLSDVAGVLALGRDAGGVLIRLFVVGAPISLLLSLVALVSLGDNRYKYYSLVSGLEVAVLALVFLIIYKSQI
jgi:hypothetical protein